MNSGKIKKRYIMIHIAAIEIAILWYLWDRYLRIRKPDDSPIVHDSVELKKYTQDDYEDDVFGEDLFGSQEEKELW